MKQSLMVLLGAVLVLSSCQKQMLKNSDLAGLQATKSSSTGFSVLREPTTVPCGTPLVTDLVTSSYPPFDETVKGKLTVSNDGTNLYITVASSEAGVTLASIQILYGDQALFNDINQYSFDGYFGLNSPQINTPVPAGMTSYTVSIPLSQLQDCFLLNVHALFIKLDEWGHPVQFPVWTKPLVPTDQIVSFPWTAYIRYCKQSCIPQTCGPLRTQTPGGWGAKPSGNNPGTYLYANFQNAFPTGLTIGCTTGFTIKLTSASAVTALLPSGGKAQKLTMSYVNPTGIKNVLVGHLVALTLSVRFDAYDVNFGEAGITLGAMKIASGPFSGWTVADFLAEANRVLGGCSSAFTIEQVLETATKINENYVDGKSDNKFLVCPN